MEKEDLIQQLMNAETAEEIQQILIQNGYENSDERSEFIKEVVKASSEYKSLSMDELSSVSGGATTERDYATAGCAATVEPDSHCWGTDGGCFAVYIDYDHYPLGCAYPRCGAHTFYIAKKIRVMTFIQCMHAAPAVFMPQVLMYMFHVPGKNRKTFILSAC